MRERLFRENLRRLVAHIEKRGLRKALIFGDSNQVWLGAPRVRGALMVIDLVGRSLRFYVPALEYWLSEKTLLEAVSGELSPEVYAYLRYRIDLPDDIRVVEGGLDEIVLREVGGMSGEALYCGIDETPGSLNDSTRELLKKRCTGIGDEISGLRALKSDEEIQAVVRAATISMRALERLVGEGFTGLSERQISARLAYLMRSYGADSEAFHTIVASGENTIYPHAHPSNRAIEYGDTVVIDVGARVSEYNSDMTRVLVARGTITHRDLIEAVSEAIDRSLEKISHGVRASDIDETSREVLRRRGLGKYFIHSTGHGVGIDVHERPFISSSSGDVLSERMVFTIEPGVYIKEERIGIRIEELVLLDKRGPKVITETQRVLYY